MRMAGKVSSGTLPAAARTWRGVGQAGREGGRECCCEGLRSEIIVMVRKAQHQDRFASALERTAGQARVQVATEDQAVPVSGLRLLR